MIKKRTLHDGDKFNMNSFLKQIYFLRTYNIGVHLQWTVSYKYRALTYNPIT